MMRKIFLIFKFYYYKIFYPKFYRNIKHGKNFRCQAGIDAVFPELIEIGDFSGIGANVDMPHDIVIGSHVMLGRQTHIFAANHTFDRKDVSMNMQREVHRKRIIIEDDCWIGLRVIILPGKIIRKGSITGRLK